MSGYKLKKCTVDRSPKYWKNGIDNLRVNLKFEHFGDITEISMKQIIEEVLSKISIINFE